MVPTHPWARLSFGVTSAFAIEFLCSEELIEYSDCISGFLKYLSPKPLYPVTLPATTPSLAPSLHPLSLHPSIPYASRSDSALLSLFCFCVGTGSLYGHSGGGRVSSLYSDTPSKTVPLLLFFNIVTLWLSSATSLSSSSLSLCGKIFLLTMWLLPKQNFVCYYLMSPCSFFKSIVKPT